MKDFITRTRNDEVLDIPIALLSDAGTSDVITDDLEVDSKKKFNSRYEIGVYLAELLKPIKIDKYLGDSGFWDWFSLLWFDQLCRSQAGIFKPSDLVNWLLSNDYKHRVRHCIYIPWQMVNRYGIEAQFACSKLVERGEIQEQLMQRQKIFGWDAAWRLASAIYSDYAKKIFTETNFTDKDKIDVVGCSRLSKSISFKKKLPKNQILYYAIENRRGLADPYIEYYGDKFFDDLKEHKQYNTKNNWNFLHIKTLKILKKFAIKNPEISIIIKIKTGQSQNIKQYYNLPKNIKLQYYGPGHQLLEESKVIIAWNTTAILEGIAANRFILLPYFISKNNNINKDSELALKLKNENYGYSENDFYKKLDLFVKKEFKINQINNNQYQLKYHLANADNKACLRLNRFLIENIK